MDTQNDNIDISQLKAFALGLDNDLVSKAMHLMPVTSGMHAN